MLLVGLLLSVILMGRKGWTQIEVPSGWTQIIRGRRPPSVQWPPADRRRQDSKRNPSAASKNRSQVPQQVHAKVTITPDTKVGRLEAARSALEAALKEAKSEGPRRSTPQDRMAAASARVSRLEAALQVLGEDSPDAAPLKVALDQARGQAKIRPVGERLDSCLQFVERVKKQITRAQERERQAQLDKTFQEEKLAEGLRNLEALRAEANAQSQSEVGEPRQPSAGPTIQEMEVEDPAELISQLRAQVASLQAERQAVCESEASRQKKARTLTCVSPDLVPLVGGGRSTSRSDMMSSLIEAADSTLKDAARSAI